MKKNGIIFILTFLVAFLGGYLFFGNSGNTEEIAMNDASVTDEESTTEAGETSDSTETAATVPSEAEPLANNNCLSCHAVESLGAAGGTTGPDLSNAYTEVEGKHGKPLDDFLQEPTSAVMTTVINEDNPLPDEEREAIVEALKIAAEQ